MQLTPEEQDRLRSLEETLWVAETRFDPVLMDQTFADDFVEFGRSGRRYERAEMLIEPGPNATINAKLPLDDYVAVLIAPDVVLATYTSQVHHDDKLERGRRSSVWVRTEGRWKLRFHQGTPC